jgi:hypothetical protein
LFLGFEKPALSVINNGLMIIESYGENIKRDCVAPEKKERAL